MKRFMWLTPLIFLALIFVDPFGTFSQDPVIPLGLTIWKNPATKVVECRFVFQGSHGRIVKMDAAAFCEAQVQAVQTLHKAAEDWIIANPVADPEAENRLQLHKRELEAEGFTVKKP